MKADVLLGLQWGDEGKGKVVDVLSTGYDIIARFQGGPNAGHTLEFNGMKHVLHTIPSGIFHKGKINIIGNGVVIDPIVFKKEIDALDELHAAGLHGLLISNRAHLILPTHRLLDAASEKAKGQKKIGSTLRGIGPAYMDKTGRNGLRAGDLQNGDFRKKYQALVNKHLQLLKLFDFPPDGLKEQEKEWFEGIEAMKKFNRIDSEYYINEALSNGKKVLAEGAQGSLLDIDFGAYPYVTSSNTTCAGACTGLGIPPSRIGKVFGIMKAYCTRVGGGPFPTELSDETGEKIRQAGKEFGATTGRPRRCGWLDLPALKYSIMLNGVTELIMTKADVLSHFDMIKVCVAYKTEKTSDALPFDMDGVQPVYREFSGWNALIPEITSYKALPENLKAYILFIEEATGLPVTIISVGPERTQVLFKNNKPR